MSFKEWFKDNNELDSTIRLIGGLFIFSLFLFGLFYLDWHKPEQGEKLLTEAVVHSVLSFCAGWIAGSRLQGKNGSQAGYGYPPEPPTRDILKDQSKKERLR